jgi:hypothetical protein
VFKTAQQDIPMSLFDTSFPAEASEAAAHRAPAESSRHYQHAQVSISSDEDLLDIQHTGTTDESMNGGHHGAGRLGPAGESPDDSGNYHAGAEPDIPGLGES